VAGRAREISAGLTPLVKWGLPAIFLVEGLSFVADWVAYLHDGRSAPAFVIVMAIGCVLFFPWVAAGCLHLKRVTLTDDALRISNYRRQIVVPLREVASVAHARLGVRAIIVRFAHETEFGAEIRFLPRRTFSSVGGGGLFWSSAIVDRLRDAVSAAKQATPTP
jgi:succinate dehydrogenase hydrophobic anchor subunit